MVQAALLNCSLLYSGPRSLSPWLSIEDHHHPRIVEKRGSHGFEAVCTSELFLVTRVEEHIQTVAQPTVQGCGRRFVSRQKGYGDIVLRSGWGQWVLVHRISVFRTCQAAVTGNWDRNIGADPPQYGDLQS